MAARALQKLPFAGSKRIAVLQNLRGQTVYLLGTAHVSKRSEAEARELIHHVKPRAVFLELCEQRTKILEDDNGRDDSMTFRERLDAVRSGEINGFTMLYRMLMKMYDLKPGGEFKAAAAAAKEIGDVSIVLGDRLMGITVARFWKGLTLWEKIKLINKLRPRMSADSKDGNSKDDFSEENINHMLDDGDAVAEQVRELGKDHPWAIECLINERDKFMVLELEQTLDELQSGDVVAVVGAGHVPGMKGFWEQRQQRWREGGIPVEESAELHRRIQMCPGMVLPDGSKYTKKMLRDYVASVVKQQ